MKFVKHEKVHDEETVSFDKGLCGEKTRLQGFWQSQFQTSILSYRD